MKTVLHGSKLVFEHALLRLDLGVPKLHGLVSSFALLTTLKAFICFDLFQKLLLDFEFRPLRT
jgi:hypothetical protein